MNLDKTIVVTGGAQGLGLACARRLAKSGARVAIADLDRASGQQAAEALCRDGGRAAAFACDVADAASVAAMVKAVVAAYGGIDGLINNAGVSSTKSFLELDEAEFDRTHRVNVKGVFLVGQAVARAMIAAGIRGSIVNITSVQAVVASDLSAYVASKGAVGGLTRSMAVALADHGIRVNAVGPGSMQTPMMDVGLNAIPRLRQVLLDRTPLGRFADPDEVASVACFLISDDASYVTGQTVFVDGGRLAQNFRAPPKP